MHMCTIGMLVKVGSHSQGGGRDAGDDGFRGSCDGYGCHFRVGKRCNASFNPLTSTLPKSSNRGTFAPSRNGYVLRGSPVNFSNIQASSMESQFSIGLCTSDSRQMNRTVAEHESVRTITRNKRDDLPEDFAIL